MGSLTKDHLKSRFGQPVLVSRATGQAYLPDDTFAPYKTWPRMPATQIVNKMAFWGNFSGEERELIERFLVSYPQMVASPPKTRMESNSLNSLPGRWLSPQKPL
jgi:hypothetical protein